MLVPDPLLAVIDAEAGDQGVSRNALIIQAIRRYLMDRHDTLAMHDAWVEQQTGEELPLDMARIALYRAAGLVQ
jgi:Ribbon-helix-helix protein, copG family